jgi:hypothetical protein
MPYRNCTHLENETKRKTVSHLPNVDYPPAAYASSPGERQKSFAERSTTPDRANIFAELGKWVIHGV